MSDSWSTGLVISLEPTPVRQPSRWERLMFWVFGRWPDSYVRARLSAAQQDDMRLIRLRHDQMKAEYLKEDA